MYSMTGYGRGEYKADGLSVTAEIKTVNNRYLDISLKPPKIFIAHEEAFRSLIKEKLTRGHAEVFISYTDKRENKAEAALDLEAARAYIKNAEALHAAFPQLNFDVTVTTLLRQGDIMCSDDGSSADEQLLSAAKEALSSALDKLNAMREIEGGKLAADMLGRVCTIEKTVEKIAERAPYVAQDYAVKLEEKVRKYLADTTVDEGRLLTEVSIFADKSNIDEEITRLRSHIAQFRAIAKEGLVGRKLDFLVQEFNRESNTICSKANDIEITRFGLELKNEIEKIREQVQNVE